MPMSSPENLLPIAAELCALNPAAVCELGVGFGLIGGLTRQMLDVIHGRVQPNAWRHTIVGIEGFPEYKNPMWEIYNRVSIADFRLMYGEIKKWPLVMMIDSLEHVERHEADAILDDLVNNNRHVIISVPLGTCPQEAEFGNELERHRSTWNGPEEFSRYRHRVLHLGICCVVSIEGNLG